MVDDNKTDTFLQNGCYRYVGIGVQQYATTTDSFVAKIWKNCIKGIQN
jgi:hypothetical protein